MAGKPVGRGPVWLVDPDNPDGYRGSTSLAMLPRCIFEMSEVYACSCRMGVLEMDQCSLRMANDRVSSNAQSALIR